MLTCDSFREGYEQATQQYTLKRFLSLVLFLDRAKRERIDKFDPCLFRVESTVKVEPPPVHVLSLTHTIGQ